MITMSRGTHNDFCDREISGVSYRTGEGVVLIDRLASGIVRVSFGEQRFFYETLRDAEKMLYSLGIRLPDEEIPF